MVIHVLKNDRVYGNKNAIRLEQLNKLYEQNHLINMNNQFKLIEDAYRKYGHILMNYMNHTVISTQVSM